MLPEEISKHGRAICRLHLFLTPVRNGQVEIFNRFTPCQTAAKPHGLEGRLSDIEPDTFSNHRHPCSFLMTGAGWAGLARNARRGRPSKLLGTTICAYLAPSRMSRLSRASRRLLERHLRMHNRPHQL